MKVFYDDKCSICNREIEYYKRQRIKDIEWIGIHKDQEELNLKNITKDSYLKKMHVIDDNNELKVGVDAFIALWKKHQYLKYLAMIISFYPLKFIATIGYNIFAIIRFKRLYK